MRSPRVKPAARSVIAAFFGETPERAWIAGLQAHDADLSLTFVETRVALIGRARSVQPHLVLLPLRDASGASTAPLIARLHENVPNARVVLLLAAGASRAGLAEAIRAGGEVGVLCGEPDLRTVLLGTTRSERLSEREREATCALLRGLQPVELHEVLVFCVIHAQRRLSVAELAMWRGLSARAFGRRASAAHWPTPSELISWGSLLRASVMEWSQSSSLSELSRASGFASTRTLQRTAERLLQKPIERSSDLAPLLVSSRLHRRMHRLERTKAL